MENIKIFKLINNEDVLGEVESDDGDYVVLLNPVGVAIVKGSKGEPSVGFAPFPLHAQQKQDVTIAIAKKTVVYSYEPAEDFISNYKQIFGAGIIVPSKQLITG